MKKIGIVLVAIGLIILGYLVHVKFTTGIDMTNTRFLIEYWKIMIPGYSSIILGGFLIGYTKK